MTSNRHFIVASVIPTAPLCDAVKASKIIRKCNESPQRISRLNFTANGIKKADR